MIIATVFTAFLATVGNGLYTTLSSLHIANLTDDGWLMGVSLSIYFVGLTLGTISSQVIIRAIGHKNCYYLLCLLTIVGTLLQASMQSLFIWLPIRLMLGFALGGMFVFYETWINQHSPSHKRQYYLSIYFTIYYIALALGQIFLQLPLEHKTLLYVVVAGMTALSPLPLLIFNKIGSNIYKSDTTQKTKISFLRPTEILELPRLGLLGSLVSGVLCGVVLSLMPYFLSLRNVEQDDLALLMLVTLLSGVVPQLFIAHLSKKFQAPILLIVCSLLIVFSVLAELWPTHALPLVVIASPVIGACVFSLYPISVNMIVDAVPAAKITSANSLTLFIYSVGCALGPLFCSLWMDQRGDEGYLYFMLLFCLALSGASLRRMEVIDRA